MLLESVKLENAFLKRLYTVGQHYIESDYLEHGKQCPFEMTLEDDPDKPGAKMIVIHGKQSDALHFMGMMGSFAKTLIAHELIKFDVESLSDRKRFILKATAPERK